MIPPKKKGSSSSENVSYQSRSNPPKPGETGPINISNDGALLSQKELRLPSLSHGRPKSDWEANRTRKVGSHQAWGDRVQSMSAVKGHCLTETTQNPVSARQTKTQLREGLTNRTRKAGSHQAWGDKVWPTSAVKGHCLFGKTPNPVSARQTETQLREPKLCRTKKTISERHTPQSFRESLDVCGKNVSILRLLTTVFSYGSYGIFI